jgi:hypothetical protein
MIVLAVEVVVLMSVRHHQQSGVSLWDIRFKGERIVYEIGTQEVYVPYSGRSAAQVDPISFSQHCSSLFRLSLTQGISTTYDTHDTPPRPLIIMVAGPIGLL